MSLARESAPEYRADIDGLRALAVILVVCFHAAAQRVPGGFIGVDVFFVISGFLISSVILRGLVNGRFSLAVFYERRIRRIFPALAIVLLATWLGGWLLLEPREFADLGTNMIGGAAFVSNIVFWNQSGYFANAAALKPLLHLWSLGIEEQFYIFWPLLLTVAWKRTNGVKVLLFTTLAASFAFCVWQTSRSPTSAFYLPGARAWELAAGGLVAYVTLFEAPRLDRVTTRALLERGRVVVRTADLFSAAGIALILIGGFALDSGPSFPGWEAAIPVLGSVLCIAAGRLAFLNARVLSQRLLVQIGLISYPLYLWHWPLLVYARRTALFQQRPQMVAAGALLAAGILSILTYWFGELPLRTAFDRRPRTWTLALCGSLLVSAAIGAGTYFRTGFPNRYPASVRELMVYKYDSRSALRVGQCFLEPKSKAFLPLCTDGAASVSPSRRIAIWGDSHGAMLYRALTARAAPKGAFVMQLTSANCPPALGGDFRPRKWCADDNRLALAAIDKFAPATVLIAANWQDAIQSKAIPLLPETVLRLRRAGASHIVMFGPVPRWNVPLPVALARYVRFKNLNSFPERMSFAVDPATQALDLHLQRIAKSLGIEYLSAYSELCDGVNCLTTVGNGIAGLTAWDNDHLTNAGSSYVLDRSLNLIFGARN